MTDTIVTHVPNPGKRIGSFAGRLFAAAALTAAVGALGSTFYEFFFNPDAYAAGSAVARATFAFAFPFPFIFAGLFVVGAPTAFVLRRFGLDYLVVFGLAGALAGAAIGVSAASGLPRLQMTFAVYGCVSAIAYWTLRRRWA